MRDRRGSKLKQELDRLLRKAYKQPGVRDAMDVYERSEQYQRILRLNEQFCQPIITTSSSTTAAPEMQAA